MPTFVKRKLGSGRPVGGRKFVVRKQLGSQAKKVVKRQKTNNLLHAKADSTIDSLNMLLEKDDRRKLKDVAAEPEENAIFVDEPETFDGVSDVDEAKDLYDQALSYERKKAHSVQDQIKMIEEENDKEKKELEAQIRELKRELHRTAPLHDTKFFSLSKELKTAIDDLEKVAEQNGIKPGYTPSNSPEMPLSAEAFVAPAQPTAPAQKVVVKPSEQAKPAPIPQSTEVPKTPEQTEAEKKGLAKKKLLVTGVSAVLVLFVMSGLAGMFFSKPKVDEKIVAQYMPGGGQVQGASTDAAQQPPPKEVDPSQEDINFEQAVWDDYKDPSFGILLQYPKNAVKVIRTDSNVTFIRKTGYLFKVQRVETTFSADDYWKQIKSTSLNYSATSEKFKGNVALKLELQDMTDYPGDRYLVKMGRFVYDIWYATPSNNFTGDDIKLAEKMLASLSIVESLEP